jgi:hypothetical protein
MLSFLEKRGSGGCVTFKTTNRRIDVRKLETTILATN